MEAFKNSMTQYVANATIWKEIIVEEGKLFHKKPLKMARKGHVTSEMARKGHVIKGRTTATGRRQHRPQATQAVHGNAGAPSPAALSKCWELFRWFAFFWFCQIPESAKHYEALPPPTNTSLQQQIGFADSGIWQNLKNADQRNHDRISTRVWPCFADSQIRWFAALRYKTITAIKQMSSEWSIITTNYNTNLQDGAFN